jgi:hypothetical protein
VEWDVFGRDCNNLDRFLGSTWAVSEAQACNQVRRRVFGDKPYADIPLVIFALRVKKREDEQISLF